MFRGGRWIRCVRQRAPRRGAVPQSRQGRAKPLRHEAILLLPRPLDPPPCASPSSRGTRLLSAIARLGARNPPAVARRRDDDPRGSREIRQPAATCRWMCRASFVNRYIHRTLALPYATRSSLLLRLFSFDLPGDTIGQSNNINHHGTLTFEFSSR